MSLLSPKSIAVIGASATEGKVGHDVLKNLVTQGFAGAVYPVNPKGGTIEGKTAYASVTDIPGPVDLAVIVTPAATVLDLVKECGRKKIPSVVVISAGFGELGTEAGRKEEEAIADAAAKAGIALVGVNCLGMIRPSIGMNASFAKDMPPAGHVALISQSGALAVAIMDASPQLHLGYSFIASIGNKTVMDECDFLALAEEDRETHVVALYLESIKDGNRFLEVAARVAKKKPIVLLKSGVTERGRAAASSHTGALAGSDAAIEAACRQAGIRRARDSEEFLDLLRVLGSEPPLLSPRIAIVTNAGGPGILATDATEASHLSLPALTKRTGKTLAEQLPHAASVRNPIDVLGDAGADRYRAALQACGDDPNIDGVAVLLTPQVMTPADEIATILLEEKRTHPLMPMVTSFFGGGSVTDAIHILADGGIVNMTSPERAIRALAALQEPSGASHAPHAKRGNKARAAEAKRIIGSATGLLPDDVASALLSLYGLPTPAQALAQTARDAAAHAQRIGFPVVLKIAAPAIIHKSDIGGVRVNLNTVDEVEQAFAEIMTAVRAKEPKAAIRGILVQKFLPAGHEFIVGTVRDATFGHLVLAGLGGIYTELFRDVSFRIAPVTDKDGYRMLQELKAWKLLLGMRGKTQSDIDALAALIGNVSKLVTECPQIRELDFNPVLVDDKGVTVADAKVLVG